MIWRLLAAVAFVTSGMVMAGAGGSPAPTECASELEKKGCCSHHKGVCGCADGVAKCCDGTLSPTCGC